MARRRSSGFDISSLLVPVGLAAIGYLFYKNLSDNCDGTETSGICPMFASVKNSLGLSGWPSGNQDYPDLFNDSPGLSIEYRYPNIGVPMGSYPLA